MKKFIAGLLCLTFMVMIFPAQVQAENTAKAKFIKNYMAYLNQSLAMQKETMGNMAKNPIELSIQASLKNLNYSEGGTNPISIPGEGQIHAMIDLENQKAQLSFEASHGDNNKIVGEGYLTYQGLVVTSTTLKSLEQAGIIDVAELLKQSSDTLPEYVLFPLPMDPSEQQMMREAFKESFTVDNYDEIAAFVEEVLNIFPDSCFQYSRGESVFKLNKSIFASAELLHNLKANSEPLVDSFVAVMQQPSNMTEEEFTSMKEMARYSMTAMIDSLEVTDLSVLDEIPVNIRQFETIVTPTRITTLVDISIDLEDEDMEYMGFKVNANNNLSHGKMQSKAELSMEMAFKDGLAEAVLRADSVADTQSQEQTMNISINIEDSAFELKAEADMQLKADWYGNPDITMPTLTEANCLTAPPPVSPSASGKIYYFLKDYENDTDITETDDEIMVFVDEFPIWFDEAYPVIRDGRTLLPLRSLADSIYADVTWQPPDTVILDHYTLSDSMYLTINSDTYKIGEEVYTSETAPVIIDGYTYVPIRFIAETFGYEVDWHPATRSVILQD